MRKQRGTSDGLAWEEDREALVAWAVETKDEPEHAPLGHIPLSATDPDGWRYRATVSERGGRLAVIALSLESPGDQEGGNLSSKLRAVSVPAILEAAAEWEAELQHPDQARLKREWVALSKQLAGSGDYPEVDPDQLERDLLTYELPSTSLLPPAAVERMAERKKGRRKSRGRELDRDHYARLSCAYLIEARRSSKPNEMLARRYVATGHPDWKGTTAKMVADWKRIATTERFGFLASRGQGRSGAEPTPALFEWAELNADKEFIPKEFLRIYGREK